MWITTCSSFSCPWEVTDIMMVIGFDMLSNIEIVMNLEITLEFVEGVACAVDVLAALVIGVVAVKQSAFHVLWFSGENVCRRVTVKHSRALRHLGSNYARNIPRRPPDQTPARARLEPEHCSMHTSFQNNYAAVHRGQRTGVCLGCSTEQLHPECLLQHPKSRL